MVRNRSSLIYICKQVKFIIDPSESLLNLYYSIERLRIWKRSKLSRYIASFKFIYMWLINRRVFYSNFKKYYYFLIQNSLNVFLIGTTVNSFLLTKFPIIFLHLKLSLFRFYLITFKTFSLFLFLLYKPFKSSKSLILLWNRLLNFKFIKYVSLQFFSLTLFKYLHYFNFTPTTNKLSNSYLNIILSFKYLPNFKKLSVPSTFYFQYKLITNTLISLLNDYLLTIYKFMIYLNLWFIF